MSNKSNGPTGPQLKQALREISSEDPGYNLGLASLILSIVGLALPALITGWIAYGESKKAGCKNNFALVGMIISGSMIGVIIIITIVCLLFIAIPLMMSPILLNRM